jgi:hypothetical protein
MMPNHYNTRSSKLNAVANGTAPLGGTSTPSTQPSPVPNPYKVPRNSATPPEVAVGATDPGTDVCTPPRNSRNGVELSNLLPIPIVTPAVASPASALASTPVPIVISTNRRSSEEQEEQEGELVVQEEQDYSTVYLPEGEEAKPSSGTCNPPSNEPADGVTTSLSAAAAHVNAAEVTDGSRFAKGTTNNTRKYSMRKKKLITEFVDVLKKNEKKYARFLVLCTNVPPEFPSQEPIESVFVLLRGDDCKPEKIRSLNEMLIDWVTQKKLVNPPKGCTSVFPAPASLNTMVRTFFASTKDYYQWNYKLKDFTYDGGYVGFFAAICEKRRLYDVSKTMFIFYFHLYFHSSLTPINSQLLYDSLHMVTNLIMSILLLKKQKK